MLMWTDIYLLGLFTTCTLQHYMTQTPVDIVYYSAEFCD